ncbi:gephyrin-like molybdotransferase Glp [Crocosphaera sp. XPORK-15E]|uniref:molybdopterin molybdotransferase MoeA n=1 Tax=Crocosphaera sp. XPORK-15E TaxID=3110247 RepID=UPI002B207231|nr:gephyrin-like molybdotransferase Glp [Crocosphaera sp. XPORK-15E]MEA5533335.1 gephyrin-like molybdotransferase Glp [Crocosphaera sp. XPORK-15E]
MITVQEADTIILNLVTPLTDTETVILAEATGRILAQSVTSQLDFPYWDNSAMDGYAVRFEDVVNCTAETPIILDIIEDIPAGVKPQKTVNSGQACRIFTGAMLPDGADTIVMQENTQKKEDKVIILSPPKSSQEFVKKRGTFYQAGNTLLSPGIIINAPEIAVLATAQCPIITVYRRPLVAILSTGDELITPSQTLKPGQIVDSNQYALTAFILKNGGIPIPLGIIPDQPQLIREKILEGINCADFVLSTGGVSVGDYDYIEQILTELGAKIHIDSVAMKPGKPLTVAKFNQGCVYFGLPGNPVSALVSCWRFVQPALQKLSGIKDDWKPKFIKAKSIQSLSSNGQRETYIWGQLKLVDGEYIFQLAKGQQNSANLINLALTNGLAILPIETTNINPEETVTVMSI